MNEKELKYFKENILECDIYEIDSFISEIRNELKEDVKEYNLFRQTPYIDDNKFNFYKDYLVKKINSNIEKLTIIKENSDE